MEKLKKILDRSICALLSMLWEELSMVLAMIAIPVIAHQAEIYVTQAYVLSGILFVAGYTRQVSQPRESAMKILPFVTATTAFLLNCWTWFIGGAITIIGVWLLAPLALIETMFITGGVIVGRFGYDICRS